MADEPDARRIDLRPRSQPGHRGADVIGEIGGRCRQRSDVRSRAAVVEPTFQKHAKQPCAGCQIHVLDRRTFKPVLTGAALIAMFRQADTETFAWRQPPYEYEHDKLPIDILAGNAHYREGIDAGTDPLEMAESWKPAVAEFERLRQQYRLY